MTAPPPRPAKGWPAFAASFGWAWTGLVEGALRDRNLRVHLAAGVLAGAVAALAPLAPAERALLLLAVALVIALEGANTALELAVDLARPGLDEGARRAKDTAAGAVLAVAAGAVLVAAAVLGPRAGETLEALGAAPLAAAGAVAASAAAGLLPWRAGRSGRRDAGLALLGVAGLAALAAGAAAFSGIAASALCLAVALEAARRARG